MKDSQEAEAWYRAVAAATNLPSSSEHGVGARLEVEAVAEGDRVTVETEMEVSCLLVLKATRWEGGGSVGRPLTKWLRLPERQVRAVVAQVTRS
jgi:hypothetical protein